MKRILLLALSIVVSLSAMAQLNKHHYQSLDKNDEEAMLFMRMSDVAYVDRVRITGEPLRVTPPATCEFLDSLKDNRLVFYSYIFFPNGVKQGKKYPLIVFPHGGIHGTFASSYIHILRELLRRRNIATPESHVFAPYPHNRGHVNVRLS